MQWLRMIKDHIATSFHMDRDDFELAPFNDNGSLGKMAELFGKNMDNLIDELNGTLSA